VFLEERIEAFLGSFLEQLKAMSDEDFDTRRRGLIVKKLEKAKNLAEEAGDSWDQIRSGYYHFSRSELHRYESWRGLHNNSTIDESDAAALGTVTKAQILDMYETYLLKGGPFRRSLAVHMISRRLGVALPLPGDITEIVDIHAFKAGLDQTTGAVPVVSCRPSILDSAL
jgi:insulysin